MNDAQENIRSDIEQLLAAMAEHPEDVHVNLVPSQRKPTIVIRCHRTDYGAILGKHGTMLASIKLIAALIGARSGLAVQVLLDEEQCIGNPAPRRRFEANPNWDPEPFTKLVNLLCSSMLGPCQVAIDRATSSTSKVSVFPNEETKTDGIEKALDAVFNCIGVIQGQRFIVEI